MLLADAEDPKSSHDFGKDILPKMLAADKRLFAYPFEGYWKDVGTVQSLWQSNMDLLDPDCPLHLDSGDFRIYSVDTKSRPQFVSSTGVVEEALINQGATIKGTVRHSVISNEVTVEKGAVVENSFLMPGAVVQSGVHVNYALIGPKQVISKDIAGKPDDVLLVNN
jgi:glucose-1-phosphate adenylyltransferase